MLRQFHVRIRDRGDGKLIYVPVLCVRLPCIHAKTHFLNASISLLLNAVIPLIQAGSAKATARHIDYTYQPRIVALKAGR